MCKGKWGEFREFLRYFCEFWCCWGQNGRILAGLAAGGLAEQAGAGLAEAVFNGRYEPVWRFDCQGGEVVFVALTDVSMAMGSVGEEECYFFFGTP